MKNLGMLLLFIYSSLTFARFGPGTSTYYVTAPTEAEVVEKAQAAIPKILRAELREIQRFGYQNRCTFRRNRDNKNRLKVTGVRVAKMYKLVDNIMTPYYRAGINYRFRNCRENDR